MKQIISVNIVAVLVLLYSSCIVFNNTANVKNNTTKVANYYKYTNLAEREIINNNFSAATKFYNLAFEEKFPFRSDLKWAKTSFVLSGEHNLNIIYKFLRYNKMMSSSSGSETIKFFKEEYGKGKELDFCDVLIPDLDTVKRKYSFNKKVLSEIKNIIKRDQDIRHFCYNKGISDIYNSKYRDTIIYTDSINLKEAIDIIKRNDITESTVGYFVNNLSIVINHASQWGFFEWYPILLEKVKAGGLKNTVFSSIVDRTYCFGNPYIQDSLLGTVYGSYQGIGLYDKYLSPVFKKSKLEKINYNRSKIYLDDFAIWEKKRIWTWSQKEEIFDLSFCPMYFELSAPPDASKEEILQTKQQQEFIINLRKETMNFNVFNINPSLE